VYGIVEDAQARVFELLKPGVKASTLDRSARKFIAERGYGKFFSHNLGHGLGLEVHELPLISRNSHSSLEEGMIFTIEPGIYLPGLFGVRIESAVLITQNGFSFIHNLRKGMIIV
jgi:Xaa-Pro aminopeptidase